MSKIFLSMLTCMFAVGAVDSNAHSKPKMEGDPLELARVLLLDGHPDRAALALAEVDPEAEDTNKREYHRLKGLAEHELGLFESAERNLKQAIHHGEVSSPTFYALASAELGREKYSEALETLGRAPPDIWSAPGAYRVEARSHHRLGQRHRAFEAADRGLGRFPNDLELERIRVLLLIELGLSREAWRAVSRFLERETSGASEHLTMADALRSASMRDRSVALLERGVLQYPESAELREALSRAYFEDGRSLTAARVLCPVACDDSASAAAAAELYTRAGKFDEAVRMNAQIIDRTKKTRQRLAILIDAERYHEAAALDATAERLGLLSDETQAYAIAYSHFVGGDAEPTERLLRRLSDPELFEKALVLRSSLEACRSEVWKCE